MGGLNTTNAVPPLGDIKLYTIFKSYATFVPECADFALEQESFLRCIAEQQLLDSGGLGFDEAVLLFNLHAVGRQTPCIPFRRFSRVLQLTQARHLLASKVALTNQSDAPEQTPARPSTAHPTRRTPDPLLKPPLSPPITSHLTKPFGLTDARPATAPSSRSWGSGLETVPDGWRTLRDARATKKVGGPSVCRPEDMPVLLPREMPIPGEAPEGVRAQLERCGRLCVIGRYEHARKTLRKAKQLWADHISVLEARLKETASNQHGSETRSLKHRSGQNITTKGDSQGRIEPELEESDESGSEDGRDADKERIERLRALDALKDESLEASTCVSMWACHVALCEGELIAAEAALLLAVENEAEKKGDTKCDVISMDDTSVKFEVLSFETGETRREAWGGGMVAGGNVAPLNGSSAQESQTPALPQTSEIAPPVGSPTLPISGISVPVIETQPLLTQVKEPKHFPRSPVLLELMGILSFHKSEFQDARECFVRAGGEDCEPLLAELGCGRGGEPVPLEKTPPPPSKKPLGKSKSLGRAPSKKKVVKIEKKVEKGPGAYSVRTFGLVSPREVEFQGGEETLSQGGGSGVLRAKRISRPGGVAKEVAILNNVGACCHVLRERKKALACYQKALALLADSDDAPGRAVVQRNKARLYHVYSGLKPTWFHVASSLESPPPTPHAAGQPDYGLDTVRAAAAGALGKGVVKTLGLRGPLRDQLVGTDSKTGKGFDWTKVLPDEKDKKKRGAKGAKKGKK